MINSGYSTDILQHTEKKKIFLAANFYQPSPARRACASSSNYMNAERQAGLSLVWGTDAAFMKMYFLLPLVSTGLWLPAWWFAPIFSIPRLQGEMWTPCSQSLISKYTFRKSNVSSRTWCALPNEGKASEAAAKGKPFCSSDSMYVLSLTFPLSEYLPCANNMRFI